MKIYCVSFADANGEAGEMCYPAMTAKNAIDMCEADFDGIIVTNVEEINY